MCPSLIQFITSCTLSRPFKVSLLPGIWKEHRLICVNLPGTGQISMSLGLFGFVSLNSCWSWGRNRVLWIWCSQNGGRKNEKSIWFFFSFNTSVVWQDHYIFFFHFSFSLLKAELSIYSWRGGRFIPFLHHIIHSEIHSQNKKKLLRVWYE